MGAFLNPDAQDFMGQPLERWGVSFGQGSERFVSGGIADQSLWVIEQEGFEIVVNSMTDHDLVLDHISNLLLSILELDSGQQVLWRDSTNGRTEIRNSLHRTNEKIENGDSIVVDDRNSSQR